MRISAGRQILLVLLVLGLAVAGTRVGAQTLSLVATGSANPVGVGTSLTYLISVTNATGSAQSVIVTNTLPALTQFQGLVPPPTFAAPIVVTNGNTFTVTFTIPDATGVQITVTASPTAGAGGGFITNSVFLVSPTVPVYNTSTNLITQVTNPVVQQADLAIGMTVPLSTVFSNDWVVYGVSVTNLGPNTATAVFLTNTLPAGVGFKSVSPASPAPNVIGSNIVFNLGSLTNGAVDNFQLTIQPTNAGVLPFVSFVNTNAVFDPNPLNNLASNNIVVSNFLSIPGQLTATIVSTQKFDQLSGRLEQNIILSNAGPASVDSARIIVTGLTNQLSNAVGTNNGSPFVTYGAALAAGQAAYLLLQFYPNQSAFTFTNSQMQSLGVSPPDLTPAVGLTPTNILLMVRLPSGGILLEFPSLTNRTYTVEYITNLLSTNWLAAQPLTRTPANFTYWIDYGPPETVSHPTNTPARFYRAFLNP